MKAEATDKKITFVGKHDADGKNNTQIIEGRVKVRSARGGKINCGYAHMRNNLLGGRERLMYAQNGEN